MNSQHEEIQKFNRLAHDFWDKNGNFKSLHQVNPLRLKFITDLCDLKGKKTLDVGCGGGILSEVLDEKGAIVTAIDLSEGGIGAAKLNQKLSNSLVDYRVQSTSELLAETEELFDVVCCLEMLEHVDDPQGIINDCSRLIKPNGFLFFSTLNKTPRAKVLAIWAAEYLLDMVPKGTHNHEMFIKPITLKEMTANAGLEPLDISGFTYHPFQQNFSLSKDVNINYIMAFKKKPNNTSHCTPTPPEADLKKENNSLPTLGVLFDLDGTLVDSCDDLVSALNQYLTSINRQPVTKEAILALTSHGSNAFLKLGLGEFPNDTHFQGLTDAYASLGVSATKQYKNIDKIINTLTDNKIPWGIVTNKFQKIAEQDIQHFGYSEKTKSIVYGDTLPTKKPSPEPLMLGAEFLNIAAEYCVYVGDTKGDIEAAQRAGMKSIAVSYGYGNDAHNWGADFVVDTVDELNSILTKLLY